MEVVNTKRKFGQTNRYLFVKLHGKPALLTPAQAEAALYRAQLQPEDVPSKWARLVKWFMSL